MCCLYIIGRSTKYFSFKYKIKKYKECYQRKRKAKRKRIL